MKDPMAYFLCGIIVGLIIGVSVAPWLLAS